MHFSSQGAELLLPVFIEGILYGVFPVHGCQFQSDTIVFQQRILFTDVHNIQSHNLA